MVYRPSFLLLALFLAFIPYGVLAETPPPPEASTLINACKAASQQQIDSGVTSEMRAGSLAVAECLETHIRTIAREQYFAQNAESLARFEQAFADFSASFPTIQWLLHNEGDHCKESCGTMAQITYIPAYIDALEAMLISLFTLPVDTF